LKRFKVFAISLLLSACHPAEIAPPSCRVANHAQSSQAGEGACVIKINSKLLVIQRSDDQYDLPFQQNLSDQSAQCAAHYGTWIETGFNVEVGEQLTTQRNGVALFACHLQAGFEGTEADLPPPPWRPSKVEALQFIYPFDIDLHQWHGPDQFVAVKDAFILYKEADKIDAINTSD
jgi:hypothetical protein